MNINGRLSKWERLRALPVADEASDKEWQWSADSKQSEAGAGYHNRGRSLDPLYERTALVEVDVGEQIATSAAPPRNDSMGTLFEQRNVIY